MDTDDKENFLNLILELRKTRVKTEIFARYNLTHFQDSSGIFDITQLEVPDNSTRFLMVDDNHFENRVISNLEGKLRNRIVGLFNDYESA